MKNFYLVFMLAVYSLLFVGCATLEESSYKSWVALRAYEDYWKPFSHIEYKPKPYDAKVDWWGSKDAISLRHIEIGKIRINHSTEGPFVSSLPPEEFARKHEQAVVSQAMQVARAVGAEGIIGSVNAWWEGWSSFIAVKYRYDNYWHPSSKNEYAPKPDAHIRAFRSAETVKQEYTVTGTIAIPCLAPSAGTGRTDTEDELLRKQQRPQDEEKDEEKQWQITHAKAVARLSGADAIILKDWSSAEPGFQVKGSTTPYYAVFIAIKYKTE